MIVCAWAVQMNGWALALLWRTWSLIALTSEATLRNVPRRVRLRVIPANQRSTWLSPEALAGLSCLGQQ
jgi:hypothetical protein